MADAGAGPLQWSGELAARWELLAEELRRRLGVGVALEPAARGQYESVLGGDLSGVRLHHGAVAGHVAEALGAEALTVGSHVLGRQERLDPDSTRGAALLGHELTHVAQGAPPLQFGAAGQTVQRAVAGTPADAEHEAQVVEQALQRGFPARPAPHRTPVDPQELADRVYRRLVEQLLLDQERAPLRSWF